MGIHGKSMNLATSQRKYGEAEVANFCPNGIILSQPEQTCVGRRRMLLRQKIRKSLKGQAFYVRYSRKSISMVNKHNLCRGGRMH
jgi:hypothetical protein